MFLKSILILSMICVFTLGLRVFRKGRFPSLLVIHALLLAGVFDVGACFLEPLITALPDIPQALDKITEQRVLFSLLMVNVCSLFFFGALLFFCGRNSDTLQAYQTSPNFIFPQPIILVLGILAVLLGAAMYFRSGQAQMILSNAKEVLGDYSSYYLLRYEVSQSDMSGLTRYALTISLYIVLPLLTLFSLQRAMLSQSGFFYGIWAVLFGAWIISSVSLLQKAPVVIAILSNLFGFVLFLTMKGVRFSRVIGAGLAGGLLLLLTIDGIYRVLGATSDIQSTPRLLYERIFEVPLVTTYFHFQVFPDLHPHTHYVMSRTLNMVLGLGQDVQTGGLTAFEITAFYTTGLIFNMNTGIVGSSWAEMGYLGILESSIIIFGLFFLWDVLLIKMRMKAAHYILGAYFLGRFMNIHNSELMFMLIAGGLIMAPMFLVMLGLRPIRSRAETPFLEGDVVHSPA